MKRLSLSQNGPLCHVFCGLILILSLVPTNTKAHMTMMGQMQIKVSTQKRQISLLLALAIQDIGTFLKLDTNGDKRIHMEELQKGQSAVTDYLLQHLRVSNDGELCPTHSQRYVKKSSRKRLYFLVRYRCPKPLGKIAIENTILLEDVGGYRHYARVKVGAYNTTTVFSRVFPTYTFRIKSPDSTKKIPAALPTIKARPTKKVPGIYQEFALSVRYIWDGIVHILIGLDHVLFLICLLLISQNLKQLFWVITAFTIGHTITLILSSLQFISIPIQPTEAAIALSVAYVAAENLLKRGEVIRHRAVLTFLFGLVHGVGISTVLREIVKLKTPVLLPTLLSFNVGVEIGQLAIVLCAYPLLTVMMKRKWYHLFANSINAGVFLLAMYWFVQRLFLTP